MKDFGGFFKGYDFNKDDKIEKKIAFQILQKLAQEVLGEGDILDILNYLDQTRSGYCNI